VDKLKAVIASAFNVPADRVTDDSSNATIPEWDSIGHINLVFALEERFGTSFTVEEIMAMRDVQSIRRVLQARLA
jgi:acyl carrier protein